MARWWEDHLDGVRAVELEDAFNRNGLVHDARRSRFIATWAYEQGEKSKAHTWLSKGEYRLLDGSWRNAVGGFRKVAETPAGYDLD